MDRRRIVKELTGLRQGPGLCQQTLARAPLVLEAMGNPPLEQGVEQLKSLARAISDGEKALVFRRAYAIDLSPPGNITQRRRDYYKETGRDIKTLIRYENEMIDALATALLGAPERARLFAVAFVRERRIFQGAVQLVDWNGGPKPAGVEREIDIPGSHESLPFFLFELPTSYTPRSLRIGLLFRDEEPAQVWAISTPHLYETSSLRYEHHITHEGDDDWYFLDFDAPQQGHFYGLGWEWKSTTRSHDQRAAAPDR